MKSTRPRYERRFFREMRKLLENERRTLRRYRIIASLTSVGGGFLVGMGYLRIRDMDPSALVACLLVAVGAFIWGFGIIYSAGYKQWPLLKRYINREAVLNDSSDAEA